MCSQSALCYLRVSYWLHLSCEISHTDHVELLSRLRYYNMTTWQATDGKGKGKQSDARAKKKKWRKYVVNSEQSPPLWHTELFSRELCSNEVTQCDCKCTFQEVCMSFNLQVIQLYIFTCPVMNLWSGEMFLTINLSFYKQQDVCVYVYLYIYFYTYLSIHPSARPPTCVYIDIYTYTHTHTCPAVCKITNLW